MNGRGIITSDADARHLVNLALEAGSLAEHMGAHHPEVQKRLEVLHERQAVALTEEQRNLRALRAMYSRANTAQNAVREVLWEAIPAELQQEVYDAGEKLAQIEEALTKARDRLAELDSNKPTRVQDVATWSLQRSAVESQLPVLSNQYDAARRQYDELGSKVSAIALDRLKGMVEDAATNVQIAKLQYHALRQQAEDVFTEATRHRRAVAVVLGEVRKLGADALYLGAPAKEEAQHKQHERSERK